MEIKACGSWNSGGRGGSGEGQLEIGDGVLKANSWKASLTFSLPTGEEHVIILPCFLYNITGEVQQVRRHVNDVL